MKEILKDKNIYIIVLISLLIGFLIGKDYSSLNNEMKTNMNHNTMQSTENHEHKHATVLSGNPIPSVSIKSYEDSMGGFNINIITKNYRFTPQDAGKENVPNTGHAHVFVNDVKVGRAYGDWYNIPKSFFKQGDNRIVVSLNGNDHSTWILEDGQTEVDATDIVFIK